MVPDQPQASNKRAKAFNQRMIQSTRRDVDYSAPWLKSSACFLQPSPEAFD